MYVGVLTHCIADNFGANLQALSTAAYLKNKGFIPVFFNWNPYPHNNNSQQVKLHETYLSRQGYIVSSPCQTDADFLNVMSQYNIRNLVVGSDCVLTYKKPSFPYCISRKGIEKVVVTKDFQFPNPFWLPFISNEMSVCACMISGSCGGSDLNKVSGSVKDEMRNLLNRFDYIGVRDNYTYRALEHILDYNKLSGVKITPDPVFGLNGNIHDFPTAEEISGKYNLPEHYVICGFYDTYMPAKKWIRGLISELHKNNIALVNLPMPQSSKRVECDYSIQLPLDTTDWYCLIKYSDGYIGNNMHPIVVSIHNSVPFYSINHHGKYYVPRYVQAVRNTKIYELLNRFGLLDYHVAQNLLFTVSPKTVVDKLIHFDRNYCKMCSDTLYNEYFEMMDTVVTKFI